MPWLVQEYVESPTLALRLKQGPLSVREVEALVRDLLDVLVHVHSLGVEHRDVKPENVLCTPRGHVLIDWGIGRGPELTALTGAGPPVGTLIYLCPEELDEEGRAGPVGSRDLYALGVLVWRCLRGVSPYPGRGEVVVGRKLAEQHLPRLGLPGTAHLEELVRRCTARDPRRRPSARAAVALLQSPPRPSRLPRAWLAAALPLALLGLLMGAAGLLLGAQGLQRREELGRVRAEQAAAAEGRRALKVHRVRGSEEGLRRPLR